MRPGSLAETVPKSTKADDRKPPSNLWAKIESRHTPRFYIGNNTWNNLVTPLIFSGRTVRSSCLFGWHERQVEVPRLALQVLDLAVATLRFHRRQVPLDVFLATGQHGV